MGLATQIFKPKIEWALSSGTTHCLCFFTPLRTVEKSGYLYYCSYVLTLFDKVTTLLNKFVVLYINHMFYTPQATTYILPWWWLEVTRTNIIHMGNSQDDIEQFKLSEKWVNKNMMYTLIHLTSPDSWVLVKNHIDDVKFKSFIFSILVSCLYIERCMKAMIFMNVDPTWLLSGDKPYRWC